MADLLILALTVFTFQNNTKIAINIHLLEIFALHLVFSYQFTAKCLSLPPPLLGGAISKPLTLPFALAFRNSNIETVIHVLEIFALLLVFSYQFTAKCLSLPPPLLGGAISRPLILPFALAFRTSNIETVVLLCCRL